MSNQVYANSSTKYYEHPGFDTYVLNGDILIANDPLPRAINWRATPSVKQYPRSLVTMGNLGVIDVQETGLYSFKFVMDFQAQTYNSVNFGIKVFLNSQSRSIANAIVDAVKETGSVAAGAAEFTTSLSYVGYLSRGDILTLTFTNFETDAGRGIAILAERTNLYICKLL